MAWKLRADSRNRGWQTTAGNVREQAAEAMRAGKTLALVEACADMKPDFAWHMSQTVWGCLAWMMVCTRAKHDHSAYGIKHGVEGVARRIPGIKGKLAKVYVPELVFCRVAEYVGLLPASVYNGTGMYYVTELSQRRSKVEWEAMYALVQETKKRWRCLTSARKA